jgi:hypothetical protein
MQSAHDVGDVLGADPDLGRIAALADRIRQPVTEGGLETSLECGIRGGSSRWCG